MKKDFKRFADISKKALKLHTLSREACHMETIDETTVAKAKTRIAEIIEELQDLISKE